MIISDFTQTEIDWLLKKCNFTQLEKELFLKRAKGDTLDMISADLNMFRDLAGKKRKKESRNITKYNTTKYHLIDKGDLFLPYFLHKFQKTLAF